MSSTKVPTTGGSGARRPAAPLADCTPLFSLAAGAAGAPVRKASGAAGGGGPRAAGGSCAPEAGAAPCRPNESPARLAGSTELHPRQRTARRGRPASSGTYSHPDGPAREAGQEESEK